MSLNNLLNLLSLDDHLHQFYQYIYPAHPQFLAHFMQLAFFYISRKHQDTFDFLMFSGGIETGQWNEIGQWKLQKLSKLLSPDFIFDKKRIWNSHLL